MAHGLASQLGGALTIESIVGKGSTISLWLPISADTAVRAVTSTPQESPVAGVALLVDDEDLVRASTADMLIDMGFEVIEAASGPEALQRLRERGGADVLITDHLMPKMTGVELAKAIAIDWPQMPVLVVSGYSDAIGIDAELPRLEKPFRQADLASALAALLTNTAPILTKRSIVSVGR